MKLSLKDITIYSIFMSIIFILIGIIIMISFEGQSSIVVSTSLISSGIGIVAYSISKLYEPKSGEDILGIISENKIYSQTTKIAKKIKPKKIQIIMTAQEALKDISSTSKTYQIWKTYLLDWTKNNDHTLNRLIAISRVTCDSDIVWTEQFLKQYENKPAANHSCLFNDLVASIITIEGKYKSAVLIGFPTYQSEIGGRNFDFSFYILDEKYVKEINDWFNNHFWDDKNNTIEVMSSGKIKDGWKEKIMEIIRTNE